MSCVAIEMFLVCQQRYRQVSVEIDGEQNEDVCSFTKIANDRISRTRSSGTR